MVIASAYLGTETAGGYFTAARTAILLSFFILSLNLVTAPQISRYYHSDRKDLVRIILGVTGLIAGFAALTGIIIFFFFGTQILALFNPLYATYLPVLLIISCGILFQAVAGPSIVLLNMSGHHCVTLILTVSIGTVSIALQAIGGLYYGAIGVAAGAAAGTVVGSLAAHQYAWRKLGLDCSGLSLAFQEKRKLFEVALRNLGPPR